MFPLDSLNLPRGSAELEKHVRPNVPLKESVHIFKTRMLLRYIVQFVLSLPHTHTPAHKHTRPHRSKRCCLNVLFQGKYTACMLKYYKKWNKVSYQKHSDWIHNTHFSKEKALWGAAEPSIYAEISSTNAEMKASRRTEVWRPSRLQGGSPDRMRLLTQPSRLGRETF